MAAKRGGVCGGNSAGAALLFEDLWLHLTKNAFFASIYTFWCDVQLGTKH